MVRALLLALLLAFALPMGAAAAPGGGAGAVATNPSLQEVAILTLNGSSRPGFVSPSVDVASAVALQHDTAASQLDRYTLAERLDNQPSTEAKQALLDEEVDEVETRIIALREDERQLRSAYHRREIDTETYVRGLVRLDARASQLRTTLGRIQVHAEAIPQFSLRARVSVLDAQLIGFEGPVRARALAAVRGDRPPTRLFVQASDHGTVLSTVEGGEFIRSTYRSDNRDPENDSGIGLTEVDERASELYPRAYNLTYSINTGVNSLSGGLFRVHMELREGFITAYLDGTTRDVFFEVQQRRLDLLGSRPTVTGAANGTRLTINRSYSGGPLQLSVVNNETGEPLQTTVVVGGNRVETGPDGGAWTLAPAGAFRVTAVGPRGNVTVTVQPLIPTSVGDDT